MAKSEGASRTRQGRVPTTAQADERKPDEPIVEGQVMAPCGPGKVREFKETDEKPQTVESGENAEAAEPADGGEKGADE